MPRLIKQARRIIGGARKKIINATANVMSAPSQMKSAYVQRRANVETGIIKKARAYDKSTSPQAVMARTDAAFTKSKIAKRNAKGKK